MEWIDGIKLTDETRLNKASLNRRELIDQVLRTKCTWSHALTVSMCNVSLIPLLVCVCVHVFNLVCLMYSGIV